MKYSTRHEEKRRNRIAVLLVVLIMAAGIIWHVAETAGAEPEWDVCYEFTNKNIEWSWAGK